MKSRLLFPLLVFLLATVQLKALTWIHGSYTGTGAVQTISGLGFQPDFIIIKGAAATVGFVKTSLMPATSSKDISSASAFVTDAITGFTANGFSLGVNAAVNTNTATYYFIAFKASAGELKVGTYTGDGSGFGQAITGAGLAPKFVMIFKTSVQPVMTFDAFATFHSNFINTNPTAGTIYSLDGDGFTLTSSSYNTNATVYYYVALGGANVIAGNFSGSNSDQTFALSAQTQALFVRARANKYALLKTKSMPTTSTAFFYAAANSTTQITALTSTPSFTIKGNTEGNMLGASTDYLAFSNGATLPIELLNFNVNCLNDKTFIEWTTASEINNDYFTIERSTDAIHFDEIATIKGAGNSITQKKYSYTDGAGDHKRQFYYRLKQTDYNGCYEYFHIAASICKELDQGLIIYPNPVADIVSYKFYSAINDDISITLFNASGQLVIEQTLHVVPGFNQFEMDVASISKGIYFIKLQGDNLLLKQRLKKID